MTCKVYEKIKTFMKEYGRILIIFIILSLICFMKLPYYINAPGGLINLEERVTVENGYKTRGSFNLTYVSEIKATIPTVLFSFIKNDWDLVKQNEVIYPNESVEEEYFRNRLLLKEANQTAILYAYQKASKEVTIKSSKSYVTYIDEKAKTNLKIGDQILKVEDRPIKSKQEIYQYLEKKHENNTITFTVKRDDEEIKATGVFQDYDGDLAIGIMVSEDLELEENPKAKLSFHQSESGPSGGFMMALSLYNSLIEDDLTHGLKIAGTGTMDFLGNVGAIGGIQYKLKGAVKEKAEIFFVPSGENYEDAIKLKKQNNYDIEIVEIKTFDDAIKYLKNQ